ncbi:hypothetical protein SynRS9902_02115 [Synechococcus sp. RS9902]|nr:hypothetical protein SynRS9902_02115 [Synechococcus sp. RS9902]
MPEGRAPGRGMGGVGVSLFNQLDSGWVEAFEAFRPIDSC